jgi:hypothetical protein
MSGEEHVVSRYTKGVATAGALILVLYSLAVALVPGQAAAAFLSDWGSAAIGFTTAGFILWTALQFHSDESLRYQWMLIGAAVTCWSFGDTLYAMIESSTHLAPVIPGLQDVFYAAGYVLAPVALFMIAYSYRRLVDMRWPVFVAGGITAALAGVMWLGVIQPSLETATADFAERVTLAIYPLAVVMLALGPVILILITITRLGKGRLAWPWWFGAAGAGVVAISETVFSYLNFHTGYTSGSAVDYGWMLGYFLILIGSLLERDVQAWDRESR